MSDKKKSAKKGYAAGHKRQAVRDTLYDKLRSIPQIEVGKTVLKLEVDPIGEKKSVFLKLKGKF